MKVIKKGSVIYSTWLSRFLFLLILMSILGYEASSYANKVVEPFEIYVSPKGNDAHAGTRNAPLKTLDAARDRLRILRKNQKEKPVTVWVGGGIYELNKRIVFEEVDSGTETAKVVYQAVEGEYPIFSGSKSLKKWSLLKDKKVLHQLDPAVHKNVYVTNLKDAGIHNFGDPTALGKRPELFCNKQLQTLIFQLQARKKGILLIQKPIKIVGQRKKMFGWEDIGTGTGARNFKRLRV
jgi:hypothetical protein